VVVTVVGLLSATSASASPIVLDFEGLAAMTFVSGNPIPDAARLSDQFLAIAGVTFSSGDPYVAVVELGDGHATSGVNGIGGARPGGVLTYDRAFPVVATFFDPANPSVPGVTDFVSVRADLAGEGQLITLNAYDVHGALLQSFTTVNSGGPTLSVTAPGIHSVRFLGTIDTAGAALDDFTFNPVEPASIPEPSILTLLSVVAAGGAGLNRLRAVRPPRGGPSEPQSGT
jgi:hypothetical protein